MSRSIFIGDVHGCADELADLFDRAALTAQDRVVFVGDLLTRGPDPAGVLRLFRQTRAESVLGNHELRLLAAHARAGASTSLGTYGRLADVLGEEDWKLLEQLPLHLRLPRHQVLVVHAGVVPGWQLAEHDGRLLTHLRTLDELGQPSERWEGQLWGERYTGPEHVVFGHNARARLQLHAFATGLDTGCVYGGELTAMVLGADQPPPPVAERRQVLMSVKARHAYYPNASD